MAIEWKEREHSEEDELAMENEGVMEALYFIIVKDSSSFLMN